MNSRAAVDLAAALLLLTIALFGDAIVEWADPGRVDRRIAYNETQQAYTEQVFCETFGVCINKGTNE
jgi:hypothetical protein